MDTERKAQQNPLDKFKPGDFVIVSAKSTTASKVHNGRICIISKVIPSRDWPNGEIAAYILKEERLNTGGVYHSELTLVIPTELDKLIYDITD